MRLKNKVAIVTGGTGEIGMSISRRYAREGAKVVLCGRRDDIGEKATAEIVATGGDAAFVHADVSREEHISALVTETVSRFGRLDIIVNNAAPSGDIKAGMDKRITEQKFAEFEYLMKVGLYGPYWMCQYSIPEMIKHGGGVIINISSNVAVLGMQQMTGYSATKGALESLTRAIATDYAADNIRCVALRLGYVAASPMSRELIEHPSAGPALRNMQITRPGIPDDVAGIATYLASDEAAYMSGNVWPFDGGSAVKAALPDITATYKDIAVKLGGMKL